MRSSAQRGKEEELFIMTRTSNAAHYFTMGCWRVVLPKNWVANAEEQGASFTRKPVHETLQISSAIKEYARVTDADLLEFAAGKDVSGSDCRPVKHPHFRGLERTYVRDGFRFHEWWFRYSHLLVYATYVIDVEDEIEDEQMEVQQIIGSLEPVR